MESVTEPVLSPCCDNLVLVNPQAFTIDGSNGVCNEACFYLHAATDSVFSKVLAFTIICCINKLVKGTLMQI